MVRTIKQIRADNNGQTLRVIGQEELEHLLKMAEAADVLVKALESPDSEKKRQSVHAAGHGLIDVVNPARAVGLFNEMEIGPHGEDRIKG